MAITRVSTNGIYGDKYGDIAANNNNWYEAIATTVVGASAVADITFSNIPSDYTHLQIRGIGRMSSAVVNRGFTVRINGDTTTTNYYSHYLEGTGAAANSGPNADELALYDMSGASATAGGFGAVVIDILDYKDTSKFKTLRSIGGYDNNGSGRVYLSSGMWENTNAITSIKLAPLLGANWTQYTRFSLYGLRA